jgi:hypothetical protein
MVPVTPNGLVLSLPYMAVSRQHVARSVCCCARAFELVSQRVSMQDLHDVDLSGSLGRPCYLEGRAERLVSTSELGGGALRHAWQSAGSHLARGCTQPTVPRLFLQSSSRPRLQRRCSPHASLNALHACRDRALCREVYIFPFSCLWLRGNVCEPPSSCWQSGHLLSVRRPIIRALLSPQHAHEASADRRDPCGTPRVSGRLSSHQRPCPAGCVVVVVDGAGLARPGGGQCACVGGSRLSCRQRSGACAAFSLYGCGPRGRWAV